MDVSAERVVEVSAAVTACLVRVLVHSTFAIAVLMAGLLGCALYCLIVFLLTGRLPWMVRKYL